MADVKETKMVIEVDFHCPKCYGKIKKVLCCIPEIRDQVYDMKKNTVTIKVVSSSPEHIKQKIACKAGKCIKSIEIVKPPPPPPPPDPKPKPEPKPEPKPVVIGNPWQPPPVTVLMYPVGVCCCCYKGGPCHHGQGPMCYDGCKRSSCSDSCGRSSCSDSCGWSSCSDGCKRSSCSDSCGRSSCQCSCGNRDYCVCGCSK